MRKMTLIILCAAFIIMTGCWDARELSDIGIVTMTGFDLDDDGQERVTVFSVQPFGPASEIGDAATTWVGTASGKSAFEALRNLRRIATRKLVFVHNKIIIIGENKAKKGMSNLNDLIGRAREFRYDTTVYLTNGRADEMMQTPADLEKGLFREILGMSHNTDEWSKGLALDVKDFSMNSLEAYQHGFVVGNMGFYKTDRLPFTIDRREYMKLYWKETPQAIAYIAGGGVIENSRLIGWLSPIELRAYLILANKVNGGFTLYESQLIDNYEVTVDILDVKTEISFPVVSKEKITAKVKVKSTALLQEINGNIPDLDEAFIKKLERELNKELTGELVQVVKKAQNELRSDFIGFYRKFNIAHKNECKEFTSNWSEIFTKIAVDYDVDLVIKRQGLLSRTFDSGVK